MAATDETSESDVSDAIPTCGSDLARGDDDHDDVLASIPAWLAGIDARMLIAAKPLPPRQGEILRLLVAGMSEKQIARWLNISAHTVHAHIKLIYRRYAVRSRGELFAAVLRNLLSFMCTLAPAPKSPPRGLRRARAVRPRSRASVPTST